MLIYSKGRDIFTLLYFYITLHFLSIDNIYISLITEKNSFFFVVFLFLFIKLLNIEVLKYLKVQLKYIFWYKPCFVQVIERCISTNRTQIIVLEIHHSKMNKE